MLNILGIILLLILILLFCKCVKCLNDLNYNSIYVYNNLENQVENDSDLESNDELPEYNHINTDTETSHDINNSPPKYDDI